MSNVLPQHINEGPPPLLRSSSSSSVSQAHLERGMRFEQGVSLILTSTTVTAGSTRTLPKKRPRNDTIHTEKKPPKQKPLKFVFVLCSLTYLREHLLEVAELGEDGKEYVKLLQKLSNKNQSFQNLYMLGDKVSSGSVGVLYEAIHKETLHVFATKQVKLPSSYNSSAVEHLQLLLNELIVLKSVKNRSLVGYYDSFYNKSTNTLSFVMDYCEAGSLAELYEDMDMPFTEPQIVYTCSRVLEGLAYLHSNNVVHRDVKASNILLNRAGEIKLADFGTCGVLDPRVKLNLVVGTPYWMAPEIMACSYNNRSYDDRVDIWSLGITAIECAQCGPPNANLDPFHVMYMVSFVPPPTLNHPERYSPNFVDFIAKCLIKDVAKRPRASKLQQHPIFKEVDENSFKELASIADAWLGWSWAESDTESTTESPRFVDDLKSSDSAIDTMTVDDSDTSKEIPNAEVITSVSRASSLKSELEAPGGFDSETKLKSKPSEKIKTLPRSRGSEGNIKKSRDKSSLRKSSRRSPRKSKRDEKREPPPSPQVEPEKPPVAQVASVAPVAPEEETEDDQSPLRRSSKSVLPVGVQTRISSAPTPISPPAASTLRDSKSHLGLRLSRLSLDQVPPPEPTKKKILGGLNFSSKKDKISIPSLPAFAPADPAAMRNLRDFSEDTSFSQQTDDQESLRELRAKALREIRKKDAVPTRSFADYSSEVSSLSKSNLSSLPTGFTQESEHADWVLMKQGLIEWKKMQRRHQKDQHAAQKQHEREMGRIHKQLRTTMKQKQKHLDTILANLDKTFKTQLEKLSKRHSNELHTFECENEADTNLNHKLFTIQLLHLKEKRAKRMEQLQLRSRIALEGLKSIQKTELSIIEVSQQTERVNLDMSVQQWLVHQEEMHACQTGTQTDMDLSVAGKRKSLNLNMSTNWTEVKKRQTELQEFQQQERAALKQVIVEMEEDLNVTQQQIRELLAARHEKQLLMQTGQLELDSLTLDLIFSILKVMCEYGCSQTSALNMESASSNRRTSCVFFNVTPEQRDKEINFNKKRYFQNVKKQDKALKEKIDDCNARCSALLSDLSRRSYTSIVLSWYEDDDYRDSGFSLITPSISQFVDESSGDGDVSRAMSQVWGEEGDADDDDEGMAATMTSRRAEESLGDEEELLNILENPVRHAQAKKEREAEDLLTLLENPIRNQTPKPELEEDQEIGETEVKELLLLLRNPTLQLSGDPEKKEDNPKQDKKGVKIWMGQSIVELNKSRDSNFVLKEVGSESEDGEDQSTETDTRVTGLLKNLDIFTRTMDEPVRRKRNSLPIASQESATANNNNINNNNTTGSSITITAAANTNTATKTSTPNTTPRKPGKSTSRASPRASPSSPRASKTSPKASPKASPRASLKDTPPSPTLTSSSNTNTPTKRRSVLPVSMHNNNNTS